MAEQDATDPTADAIENFVAAVAEDEYAELVLSTGDTLITDWEGDGVFNPYVEPTGDHGDTSLSHILDDVGEAIQDALDTTVHEVEYDHANDVYRPYMERPTPEGGN